jgi:large subunit ribosomal protein L10
MTKEEKTLVIDELAEKLANNPHFYLTDISALPSEKTSKLRRMCFDKNIGLLVVKNTLLQKAMEKSGGRDYSELFSSLKGATAVMFSESGSEPAKLIKEFRRQGSDRPILKAAFVEESAYVGNDQLDALAAIKSKNELIGDLIALLQSPAKNVVSALQSGGNKLSGIVKTLSERPE